MSYDFYKILHLSLICLALLCLGSLSTLYSLSDQPPNKDMKKPVLGLYGLSAFMILFAGLGLIVRMQIPFPWPLWVYIKIFIWFVLAGSPILLRKDFFLPAISRLPFKKKILIHFSFLILILFLAIFSARIKY